MEKTKWPAVSGLIVGTISVSGTIPTTFAFDKPLLSATVLLWSAALAVLLSSRWLDRIRATEAAEHGWRDIDLPLDEVGPKSNGHVTRIKSSLRSLASIGRGGWASSIRRPDRIHLLVVAIVLRVEIWRNILANTQCTAITWEPLIPFIFASWDYLYTHRHHTPPAYDERPDASIYDVIKHRVIRSRIRYLIPAGLITFCSIVALATSRDPTSTFICATALHNKWLVPILQRSGTLLDVVIAGVVASVLYESTSSKAGSARDSRTPSPMRVIGSAFLMGAQITTLWCCFLFFIYQTAAPNPWERQHMWEVPGYYIWSLIKLDLSSCFTLICALLSIPHIGILDVTILTTFVSTCTITTSSSLRYFHGFPPTNYNVNLAAVTLLIIAVTAYFYIATAEHTAFSTTANATPPRRVTFQKSVSGWFYLAIVLLLLVRVTIWANQSPNLVNYHPIDMLVYNAQSQHDSFRHEAGSSTSLSEAVQNYRRRYVRHPPPGFDHWYEYATARNSVIIDDFDTIHRDILPYFAISPQVIRFRTKQLLQSKRHDLTAISIRDGKATIGSFIPDTHRWMLEGVANMMGNFVEYLPDMDIAFNINDECRITVPWDEIDALRQAGSYVEDVPQVKSGFSSNRAAQWERIMEDEEGERVLTSLDLVSHFHSHGAVHCPPGSTARTERYWDRSRMCSTCAKPHSMGEFLANWTKLDDICHQPDMAEMHGFYASPAAFMMSHDLYPIFSQSKAPGFNDILYPSAWNWMEKVKYDPNDEYPDIPFANKNDSIFWRGATSEGVSPDTGDWRGMSRQRFVHVLNDINVGGGTQVIPLPETNIIPSNDINGQPPIVEDRFRYTPVPISTLISLIKTDVHFVNNFIRCWDIDCRNQANEFGLAQPTDFQTHWQYKYLLDLDGAGFSGRFVPFLFSHSLPFKAGLFREWWDDRLTAWQHFVPLDLRGHGVWATLVYFAGLEGKVNRKEVKVPAHVEMGERIAENGRKWAEQVLRKEDMEIYFFRLLLEWGRLTDDARDELGFSIDGV